MQKTPVPLRLAPDVAVFSFPDRRFVTVGRLPMMQLFERPISGWSFVVKTLEDRVLAGSLLLLLSPLLLVAALALTLDSPGRCFSGNSPAAATTTRSLAGRSGPCLTPHTTP